MSRKRKLAQEEEKQQVLNDPGIPLETQRVRKPNRRLLAAIKEAELLSKDPNAPVFRTMDELFADLDS